MEWWHDFSLDWGYLDRTEDAKRKHELAVSMGLLSPDVKVKYGSDGQYRIVQPKPTAHDKPEQDKQKQPPTLR